MNKNLDYYLALNYPVEILKIPDNEGGGYMATIPQLGRNAFVGDGNSIYEAISNLEEVKRDLFVDFLKEGIAIPEPKFEDEEEYSGRFILRIPKDLHRHLSSKAEENGTSLNQYISSLLSRYILIEDFNELASKSFGKFDDLISNTLLTINQLSDIASWERSQHGIFARFDLEEGEKPTVSLGKKFFIRDYEEVN